MGIRADQVQSGNEIVIDGQTVTVTRVREITEGQLRIHFRGDGWMRQRSFAPDEQIETP